jgi:hypothetical protein
MKRTFILWAGFSPSAADAFGVEPHNSSNGTRLDDRNSGVFADNVFIILAPDLIRQPPDF